jgi:hypothetical protein
LFLRKSGVHTMLAQDIAKQPHSVLIAFGRKVNMQELKHLPLHFQKLL